MKQELISQAEQSLDSEHRIKTTQGIKTSAALYRTLYKEVKALSTTRDEWHNRVKEAVFRLGLPETVKSDKVKLSLRDKTAKAKSLKQIQREIAEGNAILTAFLDRASVLYNEQEKLVVSQTVIITDN